MPPGLASPGENLIKVTMEMETNHSAPLVAYGKVPLVHVERPAMLIEGTLGLVVVQQTGNPYMPVDFLYSNLKKNLYL